MANMALICATVLNHIVASTNAIIRSIEYGRTLDIKGREWKRYLKKSLSFGLCYAGFSNPGCVREAWMAGEAAFLCCAYDVVTDWRHFDKQARDTYYRILRARVSDPELQALAMDLYETEELDLLSEGGLERGAIALRFTLKMMGCEKARETIWGNLDELGRLLQIVDDVLDYEEDIVVGDKNCLTSTERYTYLQHLVSNLGTTETQRLFGSVRTVLIRVIEKAEIKAKVLLRAETIAQEKTIS
jgi:hypothetical protein